MSTPNSFLGPSARRATQHQPGRTSIRTYAINGGTGKDCCIERANDAGRHGSKNDGIGAVNYWPSLPEITDGTSNTFMFLEKANYLGQSWLFKNTGSTTSSGSTTHPRDTSTHGSTDGPCRPRPTSPNGTIERPAAPPRRDQRGDVRRQHEVHQEQHQLQRLDRAVHTGQGRGRLERFPFDRGPIVRKVPGSRAAFDARAREPTVRGVIAMAARYRTVVARTSRHWIAPVSSGCGRCRPLVADGVLSDEGRGRVQPSAAMTGLRTGRPCDGRPPDRTDHALDWLAADGRMPVDFRSVVEVETRARPARTPCPRRSPRPGAPEGSRRPSAT